MYRITLPFLLAVAAALLGCDGSNSATAPDLNGAPDDLPTPVFGSINAQMGSSVGLDDATLAPAALWTMDLDPTTLTASVRSSEDHAAVASGDTYLLDIAHFFARTPLDITGVERVDDNLRVHYTITHPIAPATNPDAPASATNRADLGVTGITLFLVGASAEAPVFFPASGQPIRCNTSLIQNADGFFQPGGLLSTFGYTNTFPYRRLVNDSGIGSRVGHPNVTPGTGNFGAQTGWQRNTWGADRMGWTGYAMLHQGQTSANSIDFALAAIGDAPLTLRVALIVKYTNPVGGATVAERIANRLPPPVKAPMKFMYRMPHGCWDLERIEVVAIEGAFDGRDTSDIEMHLRVVDWDARAEQMTATTLSQETVASKVGPGQTGMPRLSVSLPDLPGFTELFDLDADLLLVDNDTAFGGDLQRDYGGAHDPLYFHLPLSRAVLPVLPEGSYTGLVRLADPAVDAEADLALDSSLTPLTAKVPRIEAFQAFEVAVEVPPLPVDATVMNEPVPSADFLRLNVFLTEIPPVPHEVRIDWLNSGTYDPLVYTIDPGMEILSPQKLINPTIDLLPSELRIEIRNPATGAIDERTVPYTIGPNRLPIGGPASLVSTRLHAPALFELDEISSFDPEGETCTYTITNDLTDDVITSPDTILSADPMISSPTGQVTFSIWVNDAAHPGELGTPLAPLVVQLDPPGMYGWNRQMGPLGISSQFGGMGIDDVGNIYCLGHLRDEWDFGGGVLVGPNMPAAYMASYGPDGEYRWAKVFDSDFSEGANGEYPLALVVDGDGNSTLAMKTNGIIDFGGGPVPDEGLVLYAQFDTNGVYVRDFDIAAPAPIDSIFRLALGPQDTLVGVGELWGTSGSVDFGGGPRNYAGTTCGFVVKHDAQGTYQWDRVYQGGATRFQGLSVNPTGDIYAVADHRLTVDYGGGSRTSSNTAPMVLALDSAGGYRWDRLWGPVGQGSSGAAACLATTQQPGVLVAGYAADLIDLGNGPGAIGAFLVQLDSEGNWQWEVRGLGQFRGLVESDGAVIGVGRAPDDFDLGPVHYEVVGSYDAFAVSFTPVGDFRWGSVWAGPQVEYCEMMVPTLTGDFILGGLYSGTLDLDLGPLTAILTRYPAPYYSSYLMRIDGDTGLF